MTWEEMFAALQNINAFGRVSLMMRKPGDWYVSDGMEAGGNGFLEGGVTAGKTPEGAVRERWAWATRHKKGLWFTVDGGRTAVIWYDTHWVNVDHRAPTQVCAVGVRYSLPVRLAQLAIVDHSHTGPPCSGQSGAGTTPRCSHWSTVSRWTPNRWATS